MIGQYLLLVLGFAVIQAIPVSVHDRDVEDTNKDIIDLSYFGSALFGTPDLELTATLVDNFSAETDEVNPEELGSYLEGDLLVPETDNMLKNALITHSSRWPKGIVPYEIQGNFSKQELITIQNAIEQYHLHTCIRFIPRSDQSDYIAINSDKSGCWSAVGRRGGRQLVNLQTPACLRRSGTVLHELMHALGFVHEQNRKERDDYVDVIFAHIWFHAWNNFEKLPITEAFGVPYDYDSIMHYSDRAFSNNGQATMVAKKAARGARMGQRIGFSNLDIEKLNRMYDCVQPEETVNISATKTPETVTITAIRNPDVQKNVDSLLSYLISIWSRRE